MSASYGLWRPGASDGAFLSYLSSIDPRLVLGPPCGEIRSTIDGTGADGPRSEGGRRILLDNSRVYVRFYPFLSGGGHLGRLSKYQAD